MFPRLLTATLLLAIAPLAAADCGDSRLLLRSDNDVYGQAGQDQGYSAGFAATWVSPTITGDDTACLPGVVAFIDRATPWLRWGKGTQRNLALSLHHAIYTPADGTRADVIADDRPYAGLLLLGLAHHVRDQDRLASTRLKLGIVGPSAQGEMAQDALHQLFGRARFRGWDNQLRDEPLLQLGHERAWRWRTDDGAGGLGWDRIVYAGATAGNAITYANAGVELRFGPRLPDDFGSNPMRLAGEGMAPGGEWRARGWDWHFFASLEARGVAHDITLDGGSAKAGHSVDRREFVAELGLGVVLTHGPWRFAGAHYRRSREFVGQDQAPVYGSLTLARAF